MRLKRLERIDHGKTSVFITPFFILFSAQVVDICKGLVRVDSHKVCWSNSCIW